MFENSVTKKPVFRYLHSFGNHQTQISPNLGDIPMAPHIYTSPVHGYRMIQEKNPEFYCKTRLWIEHI